MAERLHGQLPNRNEVTSKAPQSGSEDRGEETLVLKFFLGTRLPGTIVAVRGRTKQPSESMKPPGQLIENLPDLAVVYAPAAFSRH